VIDGGLVTLPDATARFGPANQVTMVRALLVYSASPWASRASLADRTGSLSSRFMESARAACDSQGMMYHASLGPVSEVMPR
jgi:hypothetical protein